MYINDPFDKAIPPSLEEVILDDEPRDYHEYFWDEYVERGQRVSRKQKLYTQVCRFDQNGDHITMAKDCPHFDAEDEEGRRIRPGWTVQSGM